MLKDGAVGPDETLKMADTDHGSWEDDRQLGVWMSSRGCSSRKIWVSSSKISREGGKDRVQSGFQSQKHWPDGKARKGSEQAVC